MTPEEFVIIQPQALADLLVAFFPDVASPVVADAGSGTFTITFTDLTQETESVVDRSDPREMPVQVRYTAYEYQGSSEHNGIDTYLTEYFPKLLLSGPLAKNDGSVPLYDDMFPGWEPLRP